MRLDQFEIIIQTAMNNSMSIAAEKLHLTPQCISKSIQQIEDELGVQIFFRTRNGTFLTPDGENIYNYAMKILNLTKSLQMEYQAQLKEAGSVNGCLSVLTSPALSPLITNITKLINKKYPEARIFMREDNPVNINENLKHIPNNVICTNIFQSELSNYISNYNKSYKIFLLKKDSISLCVPSNSPLAKMRTISLRKLSTLPLSCISSSNEQTPFISDLLLKKGIDLNVVFFSNNLSSCLQYLDEGLAYFLVTTTFISNISDSIKKNIVSIPLKGDQSFYYVMFINENDEASRISKIFLYYMENHFKEDIQRVSDAGWTTHH